MHGDGVIHSHPHSHEENHEHHSDCPGEAILRVDGVAFSYKSHSVLEDIEVGVSRGEILAILGPNGVGKSTLLRCMNMILRPQKGAILVDNADLSKMSANDIAKNVGYVAQRSEAARMTVFDSVLLGRKPHISWKLTKEDYAMVEDALAKFGLSSMQLRYIDEISGGELQRVCVCRAIVQEPSVLLLDEPTSALDLSRQMEILHLIRHVVDQHNCATIMTMHDLNLALRFADRFVFMKGGKIYAACDKWGVTPELIQEVYGIEVDVIFHNELPVVIPK
ncbi:MAG: ABC transporter ATP-binding protein [Oscillospiraceae bacterium]|nr:ABC transporter ATP-binding protein [Oscillospiraceae bacterium]